MRGHKVPHPRSHGGDLPGRAALDQLQVLLHGAVRVRVHIHARQVRLYERYQTGEDAVLRIILQF